MVWIQFQFHIAKPHHPVHFPSSLDGNWANNSEKYFYFCLWNERLMTYHDISWWHIILRMKTLQCTAVFPFLPDCLLVFIWFQMNPDPPFSLASNHCCQSPRPRLILIPNPLWQPGRTFTVRHPPLCSDSLNLKNNKNKINLVLVSRLNQQLFHTLLEQKTAEKLFIWIFTRCHYRKLTSI